jgi:hypothetical protein
MTNLKHRASSLVLIAVLLLAWGLAGGEEPKQEPATAELKLIKERAARYWEAKLARDFRTQYEMLEPRVRGRLPFEDFIKGKGVVEYLGATVEDAQVTGNFATVTLRIRARVRHPMLRPTPPPKETTALERWVRVRGVWYRTLEEVPPPPGGLKPKERRPP